jgi:S-DNA-T family DNA segregation ATPase FtsK/SpoIIIE
VATDYPPRPDYEPDVAVQPTDLSERWQPIIDKGRKHKKRARAAFTEQGANARARSAEWLRTGDVTDEDLIDEAMRQRDKERHQDAAQIERRLAQVRVQLNQVRTIAKHDGGDHSQQVAHLAGEQAQLESLLQAVRRQVSAPIGDREIDTARTKKKATRIAMVAGGTFATIPASSAAVEAAASGQPALLVIIGAGAAYGWYLISRPFKAGQQGDDVAPFALTPALPATFQAGMSGGAPIVGGNVVMSVEQLPEGAKPFPIRNAHTSDQLAQCVLLAMVAENVPVVEVSDVQRQPWGWQCIVRVSDGTPAALITKSGDLETKFDLPANGVRPQPIQARRACAILRLVDGDPFATAPGLPYRAPKSMSITDKFRIGTSVGGDPLELSLAGVMGLWVAASGGGKTGILQALAEGTTACYDNITIDLDPHGDGLEDLGDAVRITARTNEQIEAVLLFFLVMSKARARLRQKLGMGKKWKASAKHPAVTIFFDEFPKATDLAKRLAFDLLLVGRKELIEVEIASQGGQKGYLGENFAQMVALKAVGPCKVGDTRAVFGDGSVNEGYLPHKLAPATDTDPKDAGHIYLQGVPGRPDEPIEYAVHETPSSILRKLAEERLEAGLVEPDQDSLDAMRGVDLPEYVEAVYDNDGNIKKDAPVKLLTWEQLLRLCGAQPAEPDPLADGLARQVVEDSVAVMEKAGVDRMKTEALLLALRDYDQDAYGETGVEDFKALMKTAGAGAPITLGQIGEEQNPRGFKRDRLRHLL